MPSTKDPETGLEKPQSSSPIRPSCRSADDEGVMLVGLSARAKIHTEPLSIGARLWRLIMNTFHFRL